MIRIINSRGTGKTRELMFTAKDNDAVFVCSNPHAIRNKAENYGIIGLTFMSYSEFINESRGRRDKFVVDELEGLIRAMNPAMEFIGYSLSEE